jgi:hypothetical protein
VAYDSAYLGDMLTYYWDPIVDYAKGKALIESGYLPLTEIFDERIGPAGADAYSLAPLVMPGLPTERDSIYAETTGQPLKALPRVSLTFKPYDGMVEIPLVEIARLYRYLQGGGPVEGLEGMEGFDIITKLLGRSYERVNQSAAAALENADNTTTSAAIPFSLAVSNTAGTGAALAFASSKTMISGDTYSNTEAGAMTSDEVAILRRKLWGEIDPNGVPTYARAKRLWAGPYWEQRMDEITVSAVKDGSNVSNFNRTMEPIVIPAMGATSTVYGVSTGKVSGGPTIVYAGPPGSVGDGLPADLASRDGRPRVSQPIWNEGAEKVQIYYRTTHAIGAAISAGNFWSTGA